MLRGVTRAAVENPVTIHLLSLFLVVTGLVMYFTMPREIFPEFTRERVRVITVYQGAAPRDVEELITVKIEDAIEGIDGVESIESVSREGVSTVVARLQSGADTDRVLQDIDRAVQSIESDLPKEAEEPLVEEVKTRFPVISISLYGDVDEGTLKDQVRPIKKKMESIPGVATAQPTGLREREWSIEVDPHKLREHRLEIEDVARALAAQNLNVPAGTLEGRRGHLLVRTRGETKTTRQIEDVVVRAPKSGEYLRIRHVAKVVPGFERALTYGRFNGKRAVNITALKDKDGDILEISSEVRKMSRELDLPAGVEAEVHTDLSVFLRSRLSTMQKNAAQGFFLVMVSLCLLLNWRMAILVALGIPLAFLTAFGGMALLGVSINMMSLFAMILILGMLVDDAIIVTENVYRRIEEGETPHMAAINGTAEVARPVISTILTTVSAFLPMLLTPGEMGQWMWVVPIVVTLCLFGSALECFGILPCHIAEFAKPKAQAYPWFVRFQGRYERVVRFAFRHRYPVIASTVGLSILLFAIASTQINFTLFGKFESDTYFINFELPPSASLEETSEQARGVEEVTMSLPEEERASVVTNLGIAALDINRMERGNYLGQVVITLSPEEQRDRSITEIVDEMRAKTEELPGYTKMEIRGMQAGPGGPAIEITLESDDPKALAAAAEEVKGWLRTQDGVHGVFDDSTPGKGELEVVIDQEAASNMGLSTASVAQQVRNRFQGREATTIRRVDEDVPLMVRLPLDARTRRQTLEEMEVSAPNGERVPLKAIADVRPGTGHTKIVRSNRRRAVTVMADVDLEKANALEVTTRLKRRFQTSLPKEHQVDLQVKGQQAETEKSLTGLAKAFLVSILLVYLILGTQFKSFLQPLFVMAAIPFGIDGVLIGHMIMGKDLTFMSVMGLVALSGIVVNDSLVLVDLVNRLRAEGRSVYEAAVMGSTRRLRPILLTSFTTVLGLSPLAFFVSGQASFLSPMAISIVFGIMFSTVLTLVVVPTLYLILEDLKVTTGKMLGLSQTESPPPPEGDSGPSS